MIGQIAVRVTADRANFPLGTLFVRAGSAANVAILGVPVRAGVNIESITLRVENVDGVASDFAARALGGVWVVDIPAAHFVTVGSVSGGVCVFASGKGADGATTRTWNIGVGNLEVLPADSEAPAPTPGATFWPVRLYATAPTTPRRADAYIDDGKLKIYNGTEWDTFGGTSAQVAPAPVNGVVTLVDRAVNLVNPAVTELPPAWEWSDGLDHGQPIYGVIYDGGDYQEYGWGFSGEGGALSNYDSFGNYYDYVWDGQDATELSFYSYDTDATIAASLVTPYETDVSSLVLPPAVTGKARDFMVRLAMPEHAVMFSWPSGVEYETEDGQMPDVSEPGVYLLAFTETGAGRFALLCRKVQGVE